MCGIQHWWVWWSFFCNHQRRLFNSGWWWCFEAMLQVWDVCFHFTLAECISQQQSHLVAASAGYWDLPGLWPARGKVCAHNPLLPCLQEFFHADSLSKSKESFQDPPHLVPLPQESPDTAQETIMIYPMPILHMGLCEIDLCRCALLQQSRMLIPALPETLEAAFSHWYPWSHPQSPWGLGVFDYYVCTGLV